MVSLVDASGKEIQNYTIENIQTGGIYVVKDGDVMHFRFNVQRLDLKF